jgi:serine/threonine-protein kinase
VRATSPPYPTPRWAVTLVAVIVLGGTAQAARADYFGAIAYSPSTGCYGYSFGQDCVPTAENVALQNCNGPDRQVVVWVSNGYAALAVNNNGGYGSAWSTNCQAEADQAALNFAGGAGCGAYILCEIATGV